MDAKISDTTARIIGLKTALNSLESAMVTMFDELNGNGSDFCSDYDYKQLYADTDAIDRHIDRMLIFSANHDASTC